MQVRPHSKNMRIAAFAKHAIIEEWMREGKFNGYLTESKASSFEKKIESGITLTRLQMLLAAIMERLWE